MKLKKIGTRKNLFIRLQTLYSKIVFFSKDPELENITEEKRNHHYNGHDIYKMLRSKINKNT